VFDLNYNQLLTQPTAVVSELARFINQPLDTQAMLNAIDPELYRNRLESPAASNGSGTRPADTI
jgi:hypothetical protein